MNQQSIRPYNNTQYSIAEGATLIAELDARTKYAIDGYNSIGELGQKVRDILDNKAITVLQVVERSYAIATADPTKTKLQQVVDQINNGAGFSLNKSTLVLFTITYVDAVIKATIRGTLEGDYGVTGNNLAATDIVLFSEVALNSTSIEASTTDVIDLGDIGTQQVHTYLGELSDLDAIDVQPLADGFTIFEAIQNNVPAKWIYYGNSGLVGLNYYRPIESDLKPLTLATGTLPTLQQVVDASSSQQALFASGNSFGDDGTKVVMISADGQSFVTVEDGQTIIASPKLILKGSDTTGYQGKVLRVQADGGVDWEDFLGETSSTAYRGDRGKTAYDHSQVSEGNPHGVTAEEIGLGNVKNDAQQFETLATPANELSMNNSQINLYNWTNPTSEIAFNLTNLVAGGKSIIRIFADTGGAPQNVTINGSVDSRICSTSRWTDGVVMELYIHALSASTFEWWYAKKQR